MIEPTDIYGNPAVKQRKIVAFGTEPVVAIVGTGFYTAAQVIAAVWLLRIQSKTDLVANPSLAAVLALVVVGGIAGYATLLRWMYAARNRLETAGYEAPANWKIWAAWLIPIYNFWGPYQVMKSLRVRVADSAAWSMGVWWTGWVIFIVLNRAFGNSSEANSLGSQILVISGAAIVASYVGLVAIISEVTASSAPTPMPDAVAGLS